MSENKINEFDKFIKENMNSYEAPFGASDWNAIQQKMKPKGAIASKVIARKLLAAFIIVGVFSLAGFYLFSEDEKIEVAAAQTFVENAKNEVEPRMEREAINKLEVEEVSAETIPPKESSINQVEEEKIEVKQPEIKKEPEIKKPIIANTETPIPAKEASPVVEISASMTEICAFQTIDFRPLDSIAFSSISWDFGDGDQGRNFRVKHKFEQEGIYDVTLNIVSKSGEYISTTKTIVVNPVPKADFDYETTDFQCHNSSICFSTNTSYKTKWNFGDQRTSDELNPKHTYYRKGHYNVKLMVQNEYGCKDSTQKQVYVMRAYNLLAPNSFSPNGDGINDTWIPIALQKGNPQFELKIIDAIGKLVFTSNSNNQVWDGSVGSTNAKAGDLFFWVAVVTDSTGTPNEYGGSIMIAP